MARKQKPYSLDDWNETDFDNILNPITTPLYYRNQLKKILGEMSFIIHELGSYKSMSTKNKSNTLILARRAQNAFMQQYRQIINDSALKKYSQNYNTIGKMLEKIGVKTGTMTEPNWKDINTLLMHNKFSQLDYYTKRSVFLLERRMTLFELEGKKELQANLIEFITQKRGEMSHDEMLRDLLKTLDKHYPAGYIKIPIIGEKDGKKTLSYRKLSLESYVDTWISDVEGAIQHTSLRSTYMKAKIDLVMIKSHSVYHPLDLDPTGTPLERLKRAIATNQKAKKNPSSALSKADEKANICPICEPDIGRVFSITGADPDFPHMDFFLPRHPNCNCYMAPMPQDIVYPSDEAIAQTHEPKKIETRTG